MGLALTSMYHRCTTYPVGSYIGFEITKMPMGLALTPVYHRCTTYPVGSYIGIEITKIPMGLALTSVYDGCTTYPVSSYTGLWIAEMPTHLALTSVYHQCTTYPVGSYTGLWDYKITKSPVVTIKSVYGTYISLEESYDVHYDVIKLLVQWKLSRCGYKPLVCDVLQIFEQVQRSWLFISPPQPSSCSPCLLRSSDLLLHLCTSPVLSSYGLISWC